MINNNESINKKYANTKSFTNILLFLKNKINY